MFTIEMPKYKKKRSGVAEASRISSSGISVTISFCCSCPVRIFKTGSIIGMVKEKVSLFPKAIPHFGAKAFMNDAPHCTIHRRMQRLSLLFQYLYHNPILSLDDVRSVL